MKKNKLPIIAVSCLVIILTVALIYKYKSRKPAQPSSDYLLHLHTEELREGKGPAVTEQNRVRIHYTEWVMAGGKLVDSSYQRGSPSEFSLNTKNMLVGLKNGIIGMKVGGKRKLIIPPDMAYGKTGIGAIPPNSHLVFEVELLDILPDVPVAPVANKSAYKNSPVKKSKK